MMNKLNNLELSLMMGCSLNCDCCPQSVLLQNYYRDDKGRANKLSFENFRTVLNQVQSGGIVSFSGMSEPFHNSECADMIVYAYERGFEIWLNTTLMGMTFSDFEKLKNVKFKNIYLHIPDQEGHSKFVITDEYLQLLQSFDEKYQSSIHHYSCHGELHDAVKGIPLNMDKLDYLQPDSRAGSLATKNVENISIKGKIICNFAVLQQGELPNLQAPPVMLPDGSVILCCQDYGMKHVLGNLIHQSWDEICKENEYKKFREGLTDNSSDIICRNCSHAKKTDTLPSMMLKKFSQPDLDCIKGHISRKTYEMVSRFITAEQVCIFGLGKLWEEHFYQEYWNEGLGVTVFSDNNPEIQETYINGIKCVKPSELAEYKNLLVVVFVKNGEEIIKQLQKIGIEKCTVNSGSI